MWGGRTTDEWAPLPARLGLAIVLFPRGAQKAFGWFGGEGFQAMIGAMSEQGLPAIVPVLIVQAELLGSLGLLIGLLGRLAAAGIAAVMLGAIFLVHLPNGFFMNWTSLSDAGQTTRTRGAPPERLLHELDGQATVPTLTSIGTPRWARASS